ncbi:MAG: PadR family transcriptional regulator [Thermoproteota archaeon]|jgi:DNA-binding PadR family transcriptional regulator
MSKKGGSQLFNLNYLIVLWMLSKSPAHGYDILTNFNKMFGKKFTSGALYPMLYKLEKLNWITSTVVSEGSRRTKRVYYIRESGIEALNEFAKKFGDFFDFMSKIKETGLQIQPPQPPVQAQQPAATAQ